MTGPTVFIVDHNDTARETLQALVESVGLNVASYASAHAFLEPLRGSSVANTLSGCLLLTLRLPETSALELQARLRDADIELPVIIIAQQGDVPSAVQAMKNGAFDFLEPPINDQRLLDCVQSALAQDRARRQAYHYRHTLMERFKTLTTREKEVMLRVVQGMPNRLIAEELAVSPKTIEVHRSKVMEKIQAGSLSELINIAVTIGILSEFVDNGKGKR